MLYSQLTTTVNKTHFGPQGPHVHTETQDSDALFRGVVVIMAGISIWLTTL